MSIPIHPSNLEQLAGPHTANAVKCGNRADRPRKERRHRLLTLGEDIRHNPQTGEFRPKLIRVCLDCGYERQDSPREGYNQ